MHPEPLGTSAVSKLELTRQFGREDVDFLDGRRLRDELGSFLRQRRGETAREVGLLLPGPVAHHRDLALLGTEQTQFGHAPCSAVDCSDRLHPVMSRPSGIRNTIRPDSSEIGLREKSIVATVSPAPRTSTS